ncbi:hypothetical protein NW756_006023 [Fusarium oxysporum]|nr:hypothetical protein NW763_002841 [Fusarium oxysporum]KAJ4066939.1 hypothetical protein NW753_002022 [Fusarium oxysporum]KAJ4091813.1 hypothetical protein NW756_006023 [Fusarium oxysporum]
MNSPNIFGDRPKSRCPHCNFYPKHGENKVCEAYYGDDSFAVRVARAEASIYEEDWSWDCSLAKFVHPDRKSFKGNTSPEEVV